MRVQYFSVRRHQCRRPWGVGSGRTGSVRGVNDRSWGGFPLPGALFPRVPIPAPCTPPFPSCPLTLPFLLSPLLYARVRCGRRRLGQVRLSLGFNIEENMGFYLIVHYFALRGKRMVWGWFGGGWEHEEEKEEEGWERKSEFGFECVHALVKLVSVTLWSSECEGDSEKRWHW